MRHELVNPESLGAPKGYSNGVLAKAGRMLLEFPDMFGTQAAIDHSCSTAALISFRSCRMAFFATPLNRNIIGIDSNLATIP